MFISNTGTLWHITLTINKKDLPLYNLFAENENVSLTWEEEETASQCMLNGFFNADSTKEVVLNILKEKLANFLKCAQQNLPAITIAPSTPKDWVAETQASFKPITIGSFYIHSSYHKGSCPQGKNPIQIDAATAFGSGEHPTTQGCLQAFDFINETYTPETALDMGCGSGILAIALAKKWPALKIDACDFDKNATRTTQENAHYNNVAEALHVFFSDAYQNVPHSKQYDLIVANILANPLCEMASDLAAHLANNGLAVLSGLLDRQAQTVLRAHSAAGLHCTEQFSINGWTTLILKKDTQQ